MVSDIITCNRDLDGDDYWVTWDPRLIPKVVDDPPARGTSTSTTRFGDSEERTFKLNDIINMPASAVRTFADMRENGNGLLGRLHGKWLDSTSRSALYARAPLSRALVPLIEETMVTP